MIERRRIVGRERIIEYVLVRVSVYGVLARRLVKREVHQWILCFRIPQRDLLLLLFGLSSRCKHFFLFFPIPMLIFHVDSLLPMCRVSTVEILDSGLRALCRSVSWFSTGVAVSVTSAGASVWRRSVV